MSPSGYSDDPWETQVNLHPSGLDVEIRTPGATLQASCPPKRQPLMLRLLRRLVAAVGRARQTPTWHLLHAYLAADARMIQQAEKYASQWRKRPPRPGDDVQ